MRNFRHFGWFVQRVTAVAIVLLLASCGSGGDSSLNSADASVNNIVAAPEVVPAGSASSVTNTDRGDLLPMLFETETTLNLDYLQLGIDLIERMNASFILPADIDVVFADCGVANAFYILPNSFSNSGTLPDGMTRSEGGSIVMCHELTEVFANFYNERDQVISTSIFVLMHELGHALVSQLDLPVLGIEESYVDGMAAVFVAEAGLSEGSVLAGWFFGSQRDTPFFDSHRAGPQRLGDLACWGVGADMSLSENPVVGNIAQQLMSGGRNCAAEYLQQRSGLEDVLAPYLRGDLSNIYDDL